MGIFEALFFLLDGGQQTYKKIDSCRISARKNRARDFEYVFSFRPVLSARRREYRFHEGAAAGETARAMDAITRRGVAADS